MDVRNDLYHSTAILYVSLFRHTACCSDSILLETCHHLHHLTSFKDYTITSSHVAHYYDYEITKTHTGDTSSFQFEEEGTISFVQKRFLFYIKYMTSISFLLLSTNKTIYLLTSLHTYNREKDAIPVFHIITTQQFLKDPIT